MTGPSLTTQREHGRFYPHDGGDAEEDRASGGGNGDNVTPDKLERVWRNEDRQLEFNLSNSI